MNMWHKLQKWKMQKKEHVAQNRTGGKCDVSFNLYARNAM